MKRARIITVLLFLIQISFLDFQKNKDKILPIVFYQKSHAVNVVGEWTLFTFLKREVEGFINLLAPPENLEGKLREQDKQLRRSAIDLANFHTHQYGCEKLQRMIYVAANIYEKNPQYCLPFLTRPDIECPIGGRYLDEKRKTMYHYSGNVNQLLTILIFYNGFPSRREIICRNVMSFILEIESRSTSSNPTPGIGFPINIGTFCGQILKQCKEME